MSIPSIPSELNKVVFPSRVDEIAKTTPSRPWFSIPKDNDKLRKGWRDIDFAHGARAINRLCQYLEPRLGYGNGSHPVACCTGSLDPRPILLCLALVKLGHVGLWTAPRNTQAMHQNLFDKTGATILLHTDDINPRTITSVEMETIRIPALAELLSDFAPEPKQYPYNKSYEEIKDLPIAVVHTSGSTGMPKPRYVNTEWCNVGVRQAFLPPVDGRPLLLAEVLNEGRIYMGFPPWHGAGLAACGLAGSIMGHITYVFGPANAPPLGDTARAVMKYANIKKMSANPIIIMELSRSEEDLKLFEKLDLVTFGGGSVDKASGDRIAERTHLQTFLGSTETFASGPTLMNAPEERHLWDWFHFYPGETGQRMQKESPEEYEQYFVRNPNVDNELCAAFSMLPDLTEFHTSDLMVQHPTRANLWKFTGRTDDLIAFSNAAKFSPLAYEEQVMGEAGNLLKGAMMVGNQRPCAAFLVELADPKMPTDEALEAVWPIISRANAVAPKHAFVRKEMVIIASPTKPFERVAKGTTAKGRTEKAYKREIDAVYNQWGENWQLRN